MRVDLEVVPVLYSDYPSQGNWRAGISWRHMQLEFDLFSRQEIERLNASAEPHRFRKRRAHNAYK